MVKRVIVAVLLLPLAEIALFVLVAALIGLLGAFALMLATTFAGVVVLRRTGRGKIARFRTAVADAKVTGVEADTGGFLTVLAGFLLLLPGFLTDLLGVALLIGPVRRRCGQAFKHWVGRKHAGGPGVIDLTPGEWKQVPDCKFESRSGRRKPPR